MSVIRKVDNATMGIGAAAKNVKQGFKAGDKLCMTESGFHLGNRVSILTYYVTSASSYLNTACKFFSDHIPHIATFIGGRLDGVPFPYLLAYLGFFASGFKFCQESLSFVRQQLFLSIFKRNAWHGFEIRTLIDQTIRNFEQDTFQQSLPESYKNKIAETGGKAHLEKLLAAIDAGDQKALSNAYQILSAWTGREIRDSLEEIKNLPDVNLERALPEWLHEEIQLKGGKDYLNQLLKKVYQGDLAATNEATQLLAHMKSYARKKRLFHILGIVAAVIGGISCLGFLIAWPYALTIAFLITITLLGIAIYITQQGYVENRAGGFSWMNCVPVFLQNRFKPTEPAKKIHFLASSPHIESPSIRRARRARLAAYA